MDANTSGLIEMEDALSSLNNLGFLKSLNNMAKSSLLETGLFNKLMNKDADANEGLDFVSFCAMYFLAHPVCERCANVAFDYIDSSPRNDFITEEELSLFFRAFEQSPLEGNAANLFHDAKARGLANDQTGLSRAGFKILLGARFVETMFDVEDLRIAIVERMGAAPKRVI